VSPHFYVVATFVLIVIATGLLLFVSHLLDDNRRIQTLLDDAQAVREPFSIERIQVDTDINFEPKVYPGTPFILTNIATPECPPKPAEDNFLEMADLRRQLNEATASASRMNAVADKALGDLVSERRSNAALRGQITKLKPKKR